MHCRKCPTNLCHVTLKTVCRLEKLTVDKKYNIISLICCKITKEKMMRFWCHWLLANMPFTEEYKIIINNLFDLKGNNGKHLAREIPSKD